MVVRKGGSNLLLQSLGPMYFGKVLTRCVSEAMGVSLVVWVSPAVLNVLGHVLPLRSTEQLLRRRREGAGKRVGRYHH